MRVLFLTTLLPGLRRTGSEVASQRFVDAIRGAGHDVTMLAYRRVGTTPPTADGDVAVADRHIETLTAGTRPFGWMLKAIFTRRPYSVAKYISRAYARAVADEFSKRPPDLVVLDHAQMGWLVPRGGWDQPMVYLAHNVERAIHVEMADHGGMRAWAHRREAGRLAEIEAALLDRASAVWTLSRADADVLGQLAPTVPMRAFGVPPVSIPQTPGQATRDVVMLGGWHWKPNAAGLRWFVEEVAPLLAEHPVEVCVGGASGEEIVGDQAGVRALGPVPDALEFLQSGRVVAVPSTAGAGVQIKTLDAIASGRTVVATSRALRGLDDPPATIRAADEPADFAEQVLAALRDGSDERASAEATAWALERERRFQADVEAAIAEVDAEAR